MSGAGAQEGGEFLPSLVELIVNFMRQIEVLFMIRLVVQVAYLFKHHILSTNHQVRH